MASRIEEGLAAVRVIEKTHSGAIYGQVIGHCRRWPEALNQVAIRRLPAVQAWEVTNGSFPFW
jgi:hypothetical protein